MPTAAVPLLLLKRRLLKSLAMGAAACEVYLAAVEAVLVFYIAVFTERYILLVPAAIPIAIEISAIIKSALAVESATFLAFPFAAILAKAVATLAESATLAKAVPAVFTKALFAELKFARFPLRFPTILATFVKSSTFVPVITPTILDLLFFRA